jgi:hypothetical protein
MVGNYPVILCGSTSNLFFLHDPLVVIINQIRGYIKGYQKTHLALNARRQFPGGMDLD